MCIYENLFLIYENLFLNRMFVWNLERIINILI